MFDVVNSVLALLFCKVEVYHAFKKKDYVLLLLEKGTTISFCG
jgi:hypothetical protein